MSINTFKLSNNPNLTPDNIVSNTETYRVRDKFKFDNYQLEKIKKQKGNSLLEKIISVYKSNSNTAIVIDIKNKIDNTFGVSKGQALPLLSQKKAKFEEIKKSLTNLENYIKNGKIQKAMDLLKTDSQGEIIDYGMRLFFEYYRINPKDILNGKKVANPSNYLAIQFLNDLADIFRFQKEFKKLESTIKYGNIRVLISMFSVSNTLNINNLSNIPFGDIGILLDNLEKVSNINIKKLATILSKNIKNISVEDLEDLKNIDLSSLINFLLVLDKNSVILLDKTKINKLKKLVLILIKSKYAHKIVNDSSNVDEQKKGNAINRKTEVNLSVDDLKALEMLSLDKEKVLNTINASIAFKGMFYMLLDFNNQAKTYKGGPSKLFSDIKKAFEDYEKQKWFKTLSDSVKSQILFYDNILKISSDYNDFQNKLKMKKKEVKRAKNLILLLDVYLKGMKGKGISQKNYKELLTYILQGNSNKFLEKYKNLYKQALNDAEGLSEFSFGYGYKGYELAKIFGDDSVLFIDNGKIDKLFYDSSDNFLDGKNFFDVLKKLIINMEKDENTKGVKTNLINNGIPALLVKEYNGNINAYSILSDKNNLIYKDKAGHSQLIISSNGNIKYEPSGYKPSYIDASFNNSNSQLIFKDDGIEKSIEIKDHLPKGFYDRLNKFYPGLIEKSDKLKQRNFFETTKKQFLTTYKIIKYIKSVGGVVPIDLIEQFGKYSYLLFGETNYDLLGGKNVNFIKEHLETIKLDYIKYTEEIKEKLGKVVEEKWEMMPLYEKQILCKRFGKTCPNGYLDSKIKNALMDKTFSKILLSKKAELEYVLLNTDDKFIEGDLKELFEVNWADKIGAGIEFLAKELFPIVVAELLGTVLDLTGVFVGVGTAMQSWGVGRAILFGEKFLNYIVRYGGVEAGTYTVVSNLMHGNGIFEGYGHNVMYYTMLPMFAKGGEWLGSKLTSKGIGESTSLSSIMWAGGASIVGLETMNYMIEGENFDISQVPYDILFMALLHGTSKGVNSIREIIKSKTGVDIQGIVWNKEGRKILLDNSKTFLGKLGEKAKGILNTPEKIKSVLKSKKQKFEYYKNKDIIGGLEDGSVILKDKDGFYIYWENTTGRQLEKLKIDNDPILKKIFNDLESIEFQKGNTLVGISKNGNIIFMKLQSAKGSPTSFKVEKIIDPSTHFDLLVTELEKLKLFEGEKLKKIDEVLESKGYSEEDLQKLLGIIKNPKTRNKILEKLGKIENMSDAEIKNLGIFKKTKDFIFEKLKKTGKSTQEAAKIAEEKALEVTKEGIKKTGGLLKSMLSLSFKITGKTLKYSLIAILLASGGLMYDYADDGKLESIDWFKNHFGGIIGIVGGLGLGKYLFNNSTLGKLSTSILVGVIGNILDKNGFDGAKQFLLGFTDTIKQKLGF